jgi:hypothetical protein
MNFRIDENAVRASVAAAYSEKQASHPGEPLTTQELRAIALDALLDAMLTPPNGLIYEALNMIGAASYAAQERAEKGYWHFYQPQGEPTTWTDSMGDDHVQWAPRVEVKVFDKDLAAFAAYHKLDADELRRLGRAEIREHKGWKQGGTYSAPYALNKMYTPSLEERLSPEDYAEVMAEASGYLDSRNDGRRHPLARPIETATASPWQAIVFNPAEPDAALPFSWEPGQFAPTYPDPDAPKLPAGVQDDGPVHAAEEPKRNRFGRRSK